MRDQARIKEAEFLKTQAKLEQKRVDRENEMAMEALGQ